MGRSRPETAENKKVFSDDYPGWGTRPKTNISRTSQRKHVYVQTDPDGKYPIPNFRAIKIAYVQIFVLSIVFPDRVNLNPQSPIVSSFRSGHIDFWSRTFTWVNNNILNAIILNQFHLIIWFNLSHSDLSFGIAIVFHLTSLLIYWNRNPQCI